MNENHFAHRAIAGIVAPILGTIASIPETINPWLQMFGLLAGATVSVLSIISIVRNHLLKTRLKP